MEPNKLIYVVDENRINLLLISRRMREKFKCATRLFRRNENSLMIPEDEHPDLILMHYKLGISRSGITGERLLPVLQNQFPNCSIVMYTSLEKLNLAMKLMDTQKQKSKIQNDQLMERLASSIQ